MDAVNKIYEAPEINEIITKAVATHENVLYTRINFEMNNSSNFSVLVDRYGYLRVKIALTDDHSCNIFSDSVSDYSELPIYVLNDYDYYGTPDEYSYKDRVQEVDAGFYKSLYPIFAQAKEDGNDLFIYNFLNCFTLYYIEKGFDIVHSPDVYREGYNPLFHDEYKMDSGLLGEDLLVSIDQW